MEEMEGAKVMGSKLYMAAMKGDSSVLTSAAVSGDVRTGTKANILHISIRYERYDFIEAALQKFPHLICQSDLDNNTPFHIAAEIGKTRILELLVNCYNKAALEGLAPWRVKNSEGNTPLHVALIYAKLQFAKNLVMIDPELTAFVNNYGETPLHLAIIYRVIDDDRKSVLDAMRLVITSSPGGIPTVESPPEENSEHTITLLLETKPSVACLRDSNGLTPLLRAALLKKPDISTIEHILNYCPQSIEVCDSSGKTFLHLLTEHYSHHDDSKHLLSIQETIHSLKNRRDFQGNTPAHLAVKNRNIYMLRFLCRVTADFSIKNKEGVSAAELLQQQSEEFQKLLLNEQGENLLIPWTRIEEEDEKLHQLSSKLEERGIIRGELGRSHHLIHALWCNEVYGKRALEDDDVQEFIKQALDSFPVLICETDELGDTFLHRIADFFPTFIDQSVLRMICYYFKRFQDEYGGEDLYLPPWRIKNRDGDTPLHIALRKRAPLRCFRGFCKLDSGLLKYQNKEMQTPLHLLSSPDLSSASFGKVLKDMKGMSFSIAGDLYDKDGLTPLLKAAQEANIPSVAFLLLDEYLAEKKTKDNQKTFWHLLANETRFDPRVNRDISLGLLPVIRSNEYALKCLAEADNDGNTPLHIAIEKRNFQFAQFIMEIAPEGSLENMMRKRNGKDLTPIDLIGSAECVPREFENFIWSKRELMTHLLGARSLSGVPTAMVKDSTNTIGVIAALLATITFTAGFTVPGGLNTNNGTPLLMRKAAFQVFMVFDILAMCLSMMILFCLVWTMGNQKERVVILDLAIFLLELSFYATLLAFMTGLYVTMFPIAPWVAIFACAVCSLLVLLMRKRVVTSAIRPIIKTAFVSGKVASSVKEFLYLLLCGVPKGEMTRCSQQPNEIQSLKLKLHKHELFKTWRRGGYRCGGCDEPESSNWSFYCKQCAFDLHPKCALKNHKKDDTLSWIPKRIMTCCSQQPNETRQGGCSSPTHGDAHAEQEASPLPMWRATAYFDKKLKLELHEHELVPTWRSGFRCDECNKKGCYWSFCCVECNFHVDPECALKNNARAESGECSKVKAADEEDKAVATDDESGVVVIM